MTLRLTCFTLLCCVLAWGQGETTSAIAGQVNDASGAGIAHAKVIAIGAADHLTRVAIADGSGQFRFAQLKPGSYSVRAAASGFEEQTEAAVVAGLGQTQIVNFVLRVAAAKEQVLVTGAAPLINTENPNTATTLNAQAIDNLPNPGSDLTYPAQFAPGALINTAGSSNDFVGGQNGYGNVQFNGLPALSNAYIVDGLETNDPLTNLNSGLSTNLVLGINSIAEVTVNTTSYAVDQGRYGASQINYITKSGGNSFHGNLYELWNGSHLNAANFFTNATPGNQKPRSNVNHFGGSLGGPNPARQAVLLRGRGMAAHLAADCDHGHRPLAAVPKLRACRNCREAERTRYRARVTRLRRSWSPSIGRCSACIRTPPARHCRYWVVP